MTTGTKRGRKPGYTMSDEHKESLAIGREQSRLVRDYLDALKAHQPKRGRKRTKESVENRIATINDRLLDEHNPLTRLHLISERENLEAELRRQDDSSELTELETRFVEVAGAYSERKGISYQAWRQLGVQPNVLRAAGVPRTRA